MFDLGADFQAVYFDNVSGYERVIRVVDQVVLVCAVILSLCINFPFSPKSLSLPHASYLLDRLIPSLAGDSYPHRFVHLSMADHHPDGFLMGRHFFPLLLF